jgi:hypothetical protein
LAAKALLEARVLIPNSEADNLYDKMCQARQNWESASEVFKQAMQLSQDTGGNPDGVASLKAAVKHEIEALRKYRIAVQTYAEAVKNDRRT